VARPEAELEALVRAGLIERLDGVARVLDEAGYANGTALRIPGGERTTAEVFRPFGPAVENGPRFVYPMATTPRDGMRGFYPLERAGPGLFRWTEPTASVRITVPPGDYRLRLDLKGLACLWGGGLRLWLGDREVLRRDTTLSDGVIMNELRRGDFPQTDGCWLRMEVSPVNTSTWPVPDPRRLGLPLFAIAFVPC
jgi:hypothetical protein